MRALRWGFFPECAIKSAGLYTHVETFAATGDGRPQRSAAAAACPSGSLVSADPRILKRVCELQGPCVVSLGVKEQSWYWHQDEDQEGFAHTGSAKDLRKGSIQF
eukprot:1196373-Prorocentrum_minimum.AAC.11